MKKIVRTALKVRIYPSLAQKILIDKTLGSCRFLFNQMLGERIETYTRLKEDKDALKTFKYKTE
jgi:putative transposase